MNHSRLRVRFAAALALVCTPGTFAQAEDTALQADCRTWYDEGLAAAQHGDCEQAVPQFQEAIRHCPDLAEAHHDLGLCYRVLGNGAEAIRELKEAVRLAPTPWNLKGLGMLYVEAKDWPEALEVTNHLWETDEFTALELGFGIIAARMLPIVQSDREGLTAGERYSPEVQALILQGAQLMDQDRASDAQMVFQEAVEKDPHAVMAWLTLAKIHSGMGDRDRGVEVLEAAAEANPSHPMILHALGWGYYATQRYEQAKATWEALKSIDDIAYRTCEALIREMERGLFRDVARQ